MALLDGLLCTQVVLARFRGRGRLIRGLLDGDPLSWIIVAVMLAAFCGVWLYRSYRTGGGRDGGPRRGPRR
jgi:hypothetical protein